MTVQLYSSKLLYTQITTRMIKHRTWNSCFLSEMCITPEQFAEVLCDDLDLNTVLFVPAISQAIRQQIDAHPVIDTTTTTEEPAPDQRVILKVVNNNSGVLVCPF